VSILQLEPATVVVWSIPNVWCPSTADAVMDCMVTRSADPPPLAVNEPHLPGRDRTPLKNCAAALGLPNW
jgi:hypothetical protein